jgi:CRISPR-associated protein Csm3
MQGLQKVGFHRITGTLRLLSGLRIGGSDEMLEIGGTDLTCIKHPETLLPYVPGSSIKGRMRSELEVRFGLVQGNEPFSALAGRDSKRPADMKPQEYLLATMFGAHKNTKHQFGPSRLIFRDAQPPEGSPPMLERKTEVTIDRETGTGKHPRSQERVAAGATFQFKLDCHVYDLDQKNSHGRCSLRGKSGWEAMFEFLRTGLRLIELSGLGAGVSRGSGEVVFEDLKRDGESFDLEGALDGLEGA